jgi:hypothetical protein
MKRPRGRPKGTVERGSKAFRKALMEINTHLRKYHSQTTKLNLTDAGYLYQRDNGRCVFCKIPLGLFILIYLLIL